MKINDDDRSGFGRHENGKNKLVLHRDSFRKQNRLNWDQKICSWHFPLQNHHFTFSFRDPHSAIPKPIYWLSSLSFPYLLPPNRNFSLLLDSFLPCFPLTFSVSSPPNPGQTHCPFPLPCLLFILIIFTFHRVFPTFLCFSEGFSYFLPSIQASFPAACTLQKEFRNPNLPYLCIFDSMKLLLIGSVHPIPTTLRPMLIPSASSFRSSAAKGPCPMSIISAHTRVNTICWVVSSLFVFERVSSVIHLFDTHLSRFATSWNRTVLTRFWNPLATWHHANPMLVGSLKGAQTLT